MAAFNGMIPTNKGRNLIAKSIGGAQLLFTRVTIGDGTLTSQSIPAMTALISPKLNLPIKGVRYQSPAKTVVRAELSNQDVTTGFYFREVGLFAQDPDEGEILFAYANSGSGSAEYIPPAGGPDALIRIINVNIATGQASNVAVSVDQSVVYATQQDLEDALAGIVIEDASLTEKGIVQLDATVGGSQDTKKSVVPKALFDSLALKQNVVRLTDNFKNAASLPTEYPDGISFFKITGGVANGWPCDFGNVTTERTGSSATQMVKEVVTTSDTADRSGRVFVRNRRDANNAWQPFEPLVTGSTLTAHAVNHILHPLYAPNPTGTGTLYTVQTNPAEGISTIPDGFGLILVPNVTNTGAASVKIDAATAVPLKTADGVDFGIGELVAGIPVTFRMVNGNFTRSSGGGRVYAEQQTVIFPEIKTITPTGTGSNLAINALLVDGDFIYAVMTDSNSAQVLKKINRLTGATVWTYIVPVTLNEFVLPNQDSIFLYGSNVGIVTSNVNTSNRVSTRIYLLSALTGAVVSSATLNAFNINAVPSVRRSIKIAVATGKLFILATDVNDQTFVRPVSLPSLTASNAFPVSTGTTHVAMGVSEDENELHVFVQNTVNTNQRNISRLRFSTTSYVLIGGTANVAYSEALVTGGGYDFDPLTSSVYIFKDGSSVAFVNAEANGRNYNYALKFQATGGLVVTTDKTSFSQAFKVLPPPTLGQSRQVFGENILGLTMGDTAQAAFGGSVQIYNKREENKSFASKGLAQLKRGEGAIYERDGYIYVGLVGMIKVMGRPYYKREV